MLFFFFSSRRRHTRFDCDWSSDVCSSNLTGSGCGPQCARAEVAPQPLPVWGARRMRRRWPASTEIFLDRKSVVEGKSVDLGGRRIIKKKKRRDRWALEMCQENGMG